jgi:arylsulfatase A-like enzyme
MKSVCALLATLALLSVSQASAEEKSPAPKRPNFVVILADDMGYSDLGCYGGEIETPNIDSLADDGLRFRQFYNCSRCTSTRASLLTGYYPQRIGMGEFGRTMDLNVPTVAERLRDAGYRTAMTGKWHLLSCPPNPRASNGCAGWIIRRGWTSRSPIRRRCRRAAASRSFTAWSGAS